MSSKTSIKIVSKRCPELSGDVLINDVVYHIQTEDAGLKSCKVVSSVYKKGEIVYIRDSDYSHLTKLENFTERLISLMENQHKTAIELFRKEQSDKGKTRAEYLMEVKGLVSRGRGGPAIARIEEALALFPSDAFLLSYYGFLVATVNNDPKEGIRICEDAIRKLRGAVPFGSEFFFPAFYLNLGRTYLRAGDRKRAYEAFTEGLKTDNENHEIIWELKKMGNRRKPVVPFLKRDNPFNKYIGRLISKNPK